VFTANNRIITNTNNTNIYNNNNYYYYFNVSYKKSDLQVSIFLSHGDHFLDHMKFLDFSLTFPVEASKDYPVSSVYRYGQQSLFHINEKQGEPIVNYLTVGVVTAGGRDGVSPPQPTRGSGERRRLPSGVRGRALAEKRVLEHLELEKTHLISLPLTFSIFPDFSLTTLEFPDLSWFSR